MKTVSLGSLLFCFFWFGCASVNLIDYNVRIDRLEADEVVVIVFLGSGMWDEPLASIDEMNLRLLGEKILRRELEMRRLANYSISGTSVFRVREDEFRVGFRLKGDVQALMTLKGVPMPGRQKR